MTFQCWGESLLAVSAASNRVHVQRWNTLPWLIRRLKWDRRAVLGWPKFGINATIMRCETFIELTIVILLARIFAETASEPRWWSSRRRRHCHAQNCVLGHWSIWSSCSQSCGAAGQSKRTRAILRPASCGGAACSTRSEIKACNRFCLNGGTLMRSSCYCKAGYQGRCCEQGKS